MLLHSSYAGTDDLSRVEPIATIGSWRKQLNNTDNKFTKPFYLPFIHFAVGKHELREYDW